MNRNIFRTIFVLLILSAISLLYFVFSGLLSKTEERKMDKVQLQKEINISQLFNHSEIARRSALLYVASYDENWKTRYNRYIDSVTLDLEKLKRYTKQEPNKYQTLKDEITRLRRIEKKAFSLVEKEKIQAAYMYLAEKSDFGATYMELIDVFYNKIVDFSGINKEIELIRLKGSILIADEILTSSTYLAVYTKDNRWLEEYNQTEKRLAKYLETASNINQDVENVIAINEKLIIQERKVQAFVKKGKISEGLDLINSPQYIKQKEYFTNEMNRFNQLVNASASEIIKKRFEDFISEMLVTIGLIVTLVLLVLFLFGYQKNLNKTNYKLKILNEELNQKNAQLNNFAHIISHDLKAPLRHMTFYLEEIAYNENLQHEKCLRKQQVLGDIERAKEQAYYMYEMIDEMLAFSKISTHQIEMKYIDVDAMINQILSNISIPGNIKIVHSVKLPKILSDEVSLNQIFRNLITNAIKYNDKEQGVIEFGCKESNRSFIFSVKDNGIGIPELEKEKVFNLFYKTKNNYESHGVGLSIVKKSIEIIGGNISLESKEGKGTIFYIEIPKQ